MVPESVAAFASEPAEPDRPAPTRANPPEHHSPQRTGNLVVPGDTGPWSLLADAISDDLRSSLALVAGYRQSLALLSLDEATRTRHVERLVVATGALAQVAAEVLDLVRTTSNPPGIQRRPVAVEWLVGRASHSVEGELDAGTIDCLVAPGLPMVDVDPAWVGHALRIMVEHARRHPAAAGGLSIHAHGNASAVVVTIRTDTLDATLPARLPRLLPGRGEGGDAHLALCRQIVEANAGTLRLDETDTRCFAAISLPALRSNPPSAGRRRPR
jgi:K+-sensing histidine kinase KdpD